MSSRAPLRFSKWWGQVLVDCPAQIGAYGACLKENVQGLTKGICDKEFNVLRSCASKSLAKVKAGGRR